MITLDKSKPVRLIACEDSPLVNACFDRYPDHCAQPGFEAEYAYTLANGILGFPIEWVRVSTYEDMEAYMDNGSADMIAYSLFVDPLYGDRWGYSPTYLWDGMALIAKETIVDKSDSLLLIDQFTYDLWACMGGITVLIAIIHVVGTQIYYKHHNLVVASNKTLKLKKFVALTFNAFNVNILFGFWFLFISVMFNFYGNLMAVDLLHSNKKRTVPFQSMDELGDKLLTKECRLAIYDVYLDDDEFHGTIINPTWHNKSWARKFRDAYVINPPYYLSTREELAELILNSTCVVGLDWWTIKEWFMSRYCNMRFIIYESEPEMFYQYTFYATRHDLHDAVNTVIVSDSFQSFTETLAEKYYNKGYMPDCEIIESAIVTPLTLAKLQDGFYFLFAGFIGAMSVIMYQNYRSKRVHKFTLRTLLSSGKKETFTV